MGTDNLQNSEVNKLYGEIAEIEAKADAEARNKEHQELRGASKRRLARFRKEEREQKLKPALAPPENLSVSKTKKSHKKLITASIVIVLGSLVASWLVPQSRYVALNLLGLRGSLVISAGEPENGATTLKRFSVDVNGQTYNSGDSEQLTITGLPYGTHNLKVNKQGYGSYEAKATVDFDPYFGLLGRSTNDHIKAELTAQGTPVTFVVKDWVSGTPVKQGEFKVGDRSTKPDANGKVTVIAPPTEDESVSVEMSFKSDYLSKTIELEIGVSDQEILVVPTNKHYFVSKRSGVYSVYSSYVDGSELKEFIKGTPQETQSLQFAVSPSGKYAAMSSTREGTRDKDGNLIQKLYWVDLATGQLELLDSGQFMQLYDWSGDTLIYSYSYKQDKETFDRARLRTVDALTRNRYDIATTTGYFGQVYVSLHTIIYTKGEAFGKPEYDKGLVLRTSQLKGDSGRELATKVNVLRQLDFNKFAYQTPNNQWSELDINTGVVKSISQPNDEGSIYLSTTNAKNERILIDFVDGKRVLKLKQTDDNLKELALQSGIAGPIRFLNSTTVVYRAVTPTETADYAVSTLGGEVKKITDVTASANGPQQFFQFY